MIHLLDTGPLVAAFRNSAGKDPHTGWAVSLIRSLPYPLFTCDAVLTEAAHFLRSPVTLLEAMNRGLLVSRFDTQAAAPRLAELIAKFSDQPMDFADACLVCMSEQIRDCKIRDHRPCRFHRVSPLWPGGHPCSCPVIASAGSEPREQKARGLLDRQPLVQSQAIGYIQERRTTTRTICATWKAHGSFRDVLTSREPIFRRDELRESPFFLVRASRSPPSERAGSWSARPDQISIPALDNDSLNAAILSYPNKL